MELLLQQLANGLVIGSTYAVVAIGFALAFGVLVDTFIVRPFLVPACVILFWGGKEEEVPEGIESAEDKVTVKRAA